MSVDEVRNYLEQLGAARTCGSSNSAIEMICIEITCDGLFTCSGARGWMYLCKLPETEEAK